jgi:DoxX-like family
LKQAEPLGSACYYNGIELLYTAPHFERENKMVSTMNIALWIVQAILAIKLASVSFSHALQQDKDVMKQAILKMGPSSQGWHYGVAVLTLVSGVGLVLPAALGWRPWLTIWMAVSAAVLMLISIIFHVRYREKPLVFADVILFALAAFVAYGRWALFPF